MIHRAGVGKPDCHAPIAAALLSGAKTLFTEDMQHGRCIEGLTIRNPFAGL